MARKQSVRTNPTHEFTKTYSGKSGDEVFTVGLRCGDSTSLPVRPVSYDKNEISEVFNGMEDKGYSLYASTSSAFDDIRERIQGEIAAKRKVTGPMAQSAWDLKVLAQTMLEVHNGGAHAEEDDISSLLAGILGEDVRARVA